MDMPSFLHKGIETDLSSIDEYLMEIFIKIKGDKQGFLESLSVPLNRDPLEILGHLQNIDMEGDSDSFPYQ